MEPRNGLISFFLRRHRSTILRHCWFLLLISALPAFAQVNGSIFTTTSTGATVNGNLYNTKNSVYLGGGPQNTKDPGLQPDGTYYFQVTDPSGAVLLSADDISCRQVVVSNGRINQVPNSLPAKCTSGFHLLGTNNPANNETPIQLCPKISSPRTDNLTARTNFDAYNWCDTTPNSGGEYKVWVTPAASYNNCSRSSSHTTYGFCDSDSKTDNFKVNNANSAYITVCEFNDVDGDGVQDPSEAMVAGWPLTATGVDTLSGPIGTVNIQTDAHGCVAFSVSDFTTANGQVTISQGTLAGLWRQTSPAVGTYSLPDGVVPADHGTVAVKVSNLGAPPNTQSLTVAAGDHLTLTKFGNTCLNSSCGGNTVELTVTEDANPSLTRSYSWEIAKTVDNATVYSISGGVSSPAKYAVTVSHDNGTDSAWQSTGTIKITNPSWIDLGSVDVADSVDNGGTCTVTNGSAITIPAKSEVDLAYTCTFTSLPANGNNTATATWSSGMTTPGKATGVASLNFANPAIKVVDGSATVTDKLDKATPATLGTPSYSDASPITYTYSRTFTDPAGTCTSHTNTAAFTTNTTRSTGSAGASVQDCQVNPPSAPCVAINAVQGVAITPVTMVASGGTGTGYTFTATGLPAGLTMAANGTISGTPTASGTFSYTVTIKDGSGYTGTVTCSVTVAPPISLACAATTTGEVGVAFNAAMTASGGIGPYTYSVATGTLPAGLSLNASTGAVTGTPTAAGTFTIKATDHLGNVATTTCPITINPAISATCVAINAVQGVAITPATMSASGGTGTGYTFTATGLPAGLTMSAGGTISGTPTASGTFSYTVTVKDSAGNTGTTTCSVAVSPAVSATCVNLSATQGVAVTPASMIAGGGAGAPYSFSATGLPSGLTMSSAGVISGTPTVNGTFNYSVTITDKNGNKGTLNCSLTVASSSKATVTLTAASTTLKYPASENLVGCVTLSTHAAPYGTISFYDGTTLLTTQSTNGSSCIYWWATPPLQVGTHTLTAVYNDPANKNITSAKFTITVSRGDVTSEVDCWNANFAYGYNYQCDANNDSGVFQGYMTYSLDGGAPVTVQMNAAGHALFTILKPAVGTHHVVITYPAQGNFNSNTLPLQTFTVTPAQTQVALNPSTYYAVAKASIKFSVSLTSPGAGSPKSTGTVSFYDGSKLLGSAAVDANGQASYSTAALAAGYHTITASYSGGGYFGAASVSATIQIGK